MYSDVANLVHVSSITFCRLSAALGLWLRGDISFNKSAAARPFFCCMCQSLAVGPRRNGPWAHHALVHSLRG